MNEVEGGTWSITRALADQQQLTVVGRFAATYDHDSRPRTDMYRDLIPLRDPIGDEQYAFEVDLDRCSGCKACVTACNHLNGLSDGETWRSVGLLTGRDEQLPILQHVTTACHHCLEPACLSACPTNSYEKDPSTGIVHHLDDQCFGCQYCAMACPYEVPKYRSDLGIVRKCDMCRDRLASGEAPACVQACPSHAIRIRIVDRTDVESAIVGFAGSVAADDNDEFDFGDACLVPSAPPSRLTHPTTRYRSSRSSLHVLRAADDGVLDKVQEGHAPLVAMLILTQASVGAASLVLVGLIASSFSASWATIAGLQSMLSALPNLVTALAATVFGLGTLGVAVATSHLGRPRYAFRGWLGWRHSWLSREAIAFGLYVPLTLLVTVCLLTANPGRPSAAVMLLAVGAAAAGWAGVGCSIKLYQFTQRPFWNGVRTSLKFTLTTIILSLAITLALITAMSPGNGGAPHPLVPWLAGLLGAAVALKLALELNWLFRRGDDMLARSARLLRGPLASLTLARFVFGTLGGLVLPAVMVSISGPASGTAGSLSALGVLLLVLCVVGETLERVNYFKAVIPWRMPGGPQP